MQRHPRELLVNDAESELHGAFYDIRKKYGLSTGESLRVLSTFLESSIGVISKHMIRDERHPSDPGKPGGIK